MDKHTLGLVSRRLGLRRFSTVQLLIVLALLFFFFPFVEEVKGGELIVSILLSLVLLSAVLAAVFLVAGLGLVAFVVVNLLRFVLRAPSVNVEVLCASISAYLMLGLMWTIAYWLVAQVTPTAFAFNTDAGRQSMNGFNAFYFSFITLSTVGYGDITPVSKVARMLAAMEAMTGLFYVAVLIARLVSLYSAPGSTEHREEK